MKNINDANAEVMNYRKELELFTENLLDALYPVRKCHRTDSILDMATLKDSFCRLIDCNVEPFEGDTHKVVDLFFDALPQIKEALNKDIQAIYQGDPAAVNETEIIMTYPGFHAIASYRLAHFLLQHKVPLIPRIMTENAHRHTGIDIHPGATIGSSLCIDHGTGVVIGETTVIGNHVKIYQGVTLGALSIEGRCILGQRHPTIGDNVVIYAQATILGGDTVIGHDSIIGGNVWLTRSVAPHSKIYYTDNGRTFTKGPNS